MAAYLAGAKLVNQEGAAVQLDPALPVYLYFGAEWSVSPLHLCAPAALLTARGARR